MTITVREQAPIGEYTLEVFAFLNGKRYELDGVPGEFFWKHYMAKYPYEHQVNRLEHGPRTVADFRSVPYQARRQAMGDDWITDLTDGERYIEIALELGLKLDDLERAPEKEEC